MEVLSPSMSPHRRYNPLKGEWVLVSPHRTKRPWLGQVEKKAPDQRPAYEPKCYLCPGNQRAGDTVNPGYEHTFVFENDFAALLPDTEYTEAGGGGSELLRNENVQGTCRVVCFSPRHDLSLAEMPVEDIGRVIETWQAQLTELGAKYHWVQIFENKGAVMGCSNPHPHGQIWALDALPNEPYAEEIHQKAYYLQNESPLLVDYLKEELEAEERIVLQNEDWVVLVPYWAVWPFETMLLPKAPVQRLTDLNDGQKRLLAAIMKGLLVKYDNLFETSFPYSMGWHHAPGTASEPHWQLHAHYYPPLLRSATVKKFMVGYEMMAEAQRDITAEQAAARLREVSTVHYLQM
ncbi:MAG: UDP-glucose--hexose-1-phosphate uridylyltransferase [Anaerolineaceae bacterium]|jgi:UDPglucose--hexose-1-phosphate uridylyltransferase|nr:UDP-glucose--hexose-1-phosphate uridylyltransferase [Anaerolineaceae bacterium]